jgi:hypothetical protein
VKQKTKAQALTVGVALVSAFVLFCGSVAIWGSWWRFEGMPRPEEWSAFFGASALFALLFAWYQIRQVDESNKALIRSNDLAREVNLETVRPRVQIALDVTRSVSRLSPQRGAVYVAVRNTGPTPAYDVRLQVSPPFTSLEEFFRPGTMDEHFAKVNSFFDGSIRFPTLQSGKSYVFFMGLIPGFFDEHASLPREWVVESEYVGTASRATFKERTVINLDMERQLELPVNPLDRISTELMNVGSELNRANSRRR